jgi:hypothetical protein
VVPVSFHDFFSGCATVAGALIGLLFVALSVSPEKLTGDDARAEHQVIPEEAGWGQVGMTWGFAGRSCFPGVG